MGLATQAPNSSSERSTAPLLEVQGLHTEFRTAQGVLKAVNGADLTVEAGEILGIVGESGCGKSVTALSIMGLIPSPPGKVTAGEVWFEGRNLLTLTEQEMQHVRGGKIAMIFQDPMTSLNPTMTIGRQIGEMLRIHEGTKGQRARRRVIELLDQVGIPGPDTRMDHFPHQLSGGMRQRVMIALALSCSPKLLIADEPTTALDVTIQAQILELIRWLRSEFGMAVMTITHDLGVMAGLADKLAVMYAGRVVETGPATDVFDKPEHPYTRGLLRSTLRLDETRRASLLPIEGSPPVVTEGSIGCPFAPRCKHAVDVCLERDPPLEPVGDDHAAACWVDLPKHRQDQSITPPPTSREQDAEVLLSVSDLVKTFKLRRAFFGGTSSIHAVNGVTLDIHRGETVGLVGESGCGKTTLGRTVLQLYSPTSGSVKYQGEELSTLTQRQMRALRRQMQIVFQDPFSSLDPRMRVGSLIAEPMRIHGLAAERGVEKKKVQDLLDLVGLAKDAATRYPHEFSGGQRQRIAIARALSLSPSFLVLDEPVSALDVSVQAQIINLLDQLQAELGLTYLLIAHDLSLVRHISKRVAVMYLGRIVELGDRDQIYETPLHPYTRALLSAVPIPDPHIERARERIILSGDIASPVSPPSGCAFRTRCLLTEAMGNPEVCRTDTPPLRELRAGQKTACHFAEELLTAESPIRQT